jgi:NADH:ubiquinone oxidoreductase subunit K
MIDEMVEDEETIAAAPDASAFAPRISVHKHAHAAIYANLFFRRTIIPILLTCGLMLPAIGLWSMLDPNAPLAAIGSHVEILLIVVGAVLLALGIVNALHVNHILKTAAKRPNA